MARLTHYKPVIGNEKLNIQNWLAQAKAKILISSVKFTYNENDVALKQFFTMLEQHNDFEKILWSTEILNSIYGKSYVYFDLLSNKIPKIGIYEHNTGNSCLRIDGLTPIFVKGSRVVLSGHNGIQAKTWEYRTSKTIKRLLQSGASFGDSIPLGEAGSISTPDIVKELLKIGSTDLDFNAMSAMEILNKDIVDFLNNNDDNIFSDDYNVKHLREYINNAYQWGLQELMTNHTRIIGDFSNQDLVDMEDGAKSKHNWGQETFGDEFLRKALFVKTRGNEARVEVQTTNLSLEQQVQGLNKVIELYFQGCGLDSALVLDSTGQKTVAEVQTTYKTTFETIKKTNQLRTKQWTYFVENIMTAYGLKPSDFKGKWKFEIVSEILNDKMNNPETILLLHDNRLMTTKIALSKLYKDFSKQQIEELEKQLLEEKQNETNEESAQGNLGEISNYEESNQQNDENGENKNDKDNIEKENTQEGEL